MVGKIGLKSHEIRIDLSRSIEGEIVSDIEKGRKKESCRQRIYFFHFRGSANVQKYQGLNNVQKKTSMCGYSLLKHV